MGYVTTYSISTKAKPLGQDELDRIAKLEEQAKAMPDEELKSITLQGIEHMKKKVKVDARKLLIPIVGYDPFEDSCKWYEHDQHMRHVSLANKGTIFILEGEGEDPGDLWKKYYLDGKCQVAKASITFDEFDESKLK
jgi:nicotinic acid mononucleotide adenylyltransferase